MRIVASYKFKGNIVERNEARIESVNRLVNNKEMKEMKEIVHRVGIAYDNFNHEELKRYIIK